jgi:hypothetical protein
MVAPPAVHVADDAAGIAPAVLSRVRKLLAKAEDPAATPAEAEAFTAKAAQIVATYGIDQALLSDRAPGRDAVSSRVVVLEAPYALDKSSLLSGVAMALRCRAVQRTRPSPEGGKEISLHLFGFASDLARAELLYTSLLLQATSGMRRAEAPPWESVAAFRRSWLAGFTSAVVSRLREVEAEAERQAGAGGGNGAGPCVPGGAVRSVALVLANRDVAVRRAVEEEYPYLRRVSRRQLSGSGGRSGYLAGQRADIGGRRVGGSRRMIGR